MAGLFYWGAIFKLFMDRLKRYGLLASLLLFTQLALPGCKGRDNNVMNEFKKVDSSLQNIVLPEDSLHLLNTQILAMQQVNPKLALMADSLFVVTTYTVNYIDSLEKVIITLDSAGSESNATKKIFEENDKAGKQLYQYLLQVNYHAQEAIVTKSNLKKISNIFGDVASMPDDKVFVKKYFYNMPDAAAFAILNKLHFDCYNAANTALYDVKSALIKTQ